MSKMTSDNGIALIKKFEGIELTAYKCPAGVWTIGYGHTNNVKSGQTITQIQAETYLKSDLSKFEANVNKYNDKYDWNQNEFDALVSFAYNIGSIDQLTANGTRSRSVIAEKILLYNKAGGKELAGLTTRRQAERALFLTEVTNILPKTLQAATVANASDTDSFQVKVTANSLRIRKGPGMSYTQVGSIKDKGVYTITKVSDNWGKLLSGAGWICLDYTKKL